MHGNAIALGGLETKDTFGGGAWGFAILKGLKNLEKYPVLLHFMSFLCFFHVLDNLFASHVFAYRFYSLNN